MGEGDMVRIQVRLTKEVFEQIKKASGKMGLTVSGFMSVAGLQYMKENAVMDIGDMMRMIQTAALKESERPNP